MFLKVLGLKARLDPRCQALGIGSFDCLSLEWARGDLLSTGTPKPVQRRSSVIQKCKSQN